MLQSSLRKVACRSTTKCLGSAINSRTTQVPVAASPHPLTTQTHQRRQSSSKTSNPPSNNARPLTAPTETPNTKDEAPADKEGIDKRLPTRLTRRKLKDPTLEISEKGKVEAHFNLPSVPSTQHVHFHDIQMASFFSIHRPISLTTPIPPRSNSKKFSSIFMTPGRSDATEVITTISSAIHTLEDTSSIQEETDLRTVVTQASASKAEPAIKHVDGSLSQPLHLNIEELAKNFRPFAPPPAPIPLDSAEAVSKHDSDFAASQQLNTQPLELQSRSAVHQKHYTTTLTISESTSSTGKKTYQVHTSPIRETRFPPSPSPASTQSKIIDFPSPTRANQPFLERMRRRQENWEDSREDENEGVWAALSVKRQRRLKMKKHKYKKLMRRTRTLRRRQDRN